MSLILLWNNKKAQLFQIITDVFDIKGASWITNAFQIITDSSEIANIATTSSIFSIDNDISNNKYFQMIITAGNECFSNDIYLLDYECSSNDRYIYFNCFITQFLFQEHKKALPQFWHFVSKILHKKLQATLYLLSTIYPLSQIYQRYIFHYSKW